VDAYRPLLRGGEEGGESVPYGGQVGGAEEHWGVGCGVWGAGCGVREDRQRVDMVMEMLEGCVRVCDGVRWGVTITFDRQLWQLCEQGEQSRHPCGC
jgi:hypothetical protein